MRRILTALVRWLGEALIRLYYPRRAIEGAERIPAGQPLVFVLNHPNGLLDPLVLRVATGRPARFLAKSSLFGNPLGRLAMDAFDSIPVYRPRDVGPETAAQRNEESFARCRAELARGGCLALFPEGTSHSDPQLRPLKTGAARIALSAQAEQEQRGASGVAIVPVGLYYPRKVRFRSSVLLVVGEPIAVAPLLDDYRRDERAAVEALTTQIDARLDEVVLQAESRELLEGIARVARWVSGPEGGAAERHRRALELVDAYGRLRARDPARVEAVAAEARAFERTLRLLGVRDPWALEVAPPGAGAIAVAIAKLVLAAPVAALGALMGWIPYRLVTPVAKRVTRDEDIQSTVRLFAGALFLFLAWAGEAIAAGFIWGARWAVPAFLIGIAAGYVALRFEELLSSAVEAWRHLAIRARHADIARRLVERRRALADSVAEALEETQR